MPTTYTGRMAGTLTPRKWQQCRPLLLSCLLSMTATVTVHGGVLFAPPGPFDEGLLATNSFCAAHGRMPYHDFLCMYGFAEWYLNAGALVAFGHSLTTIRVIRLLAHAALVLASGQLAARIVRSISRGATATISAAPPAAGLATGLLVLPMFGSPCAWSLLFCVVAAHALLSGLQLTGTRGLMWCGAWLGVAAWFRVDMAISGAAGLLTAAWLNARAGTPASTPGTAFGVIRIAGMALVIALLGYAPFLARGPSEVWYGLVELPRRAVPGRLLPFPGWHESWLTVYSLHMLLLAAAATVIATSAIWRWHGGRREGTQSTQEPLAPRIGKRAAIGLCVSGGLNLAYAMGRCDLVHQIPALLYAYMLLPFTVAQLWAVRPWQIGKPAALALMWCVWRAASLSLASPHDGLMTDLRERVRLTQHSWTSRKCDVSAYGFAQPDPGNGQLEAVRFVSSHTAEGAQIYVGLMRHDQVYLNDIMFYFLCRRLPAVRDHHFDPTTTTGADFQQRIIADLVAQAPEFAVLWSGGSFDPEPNASSRRSGVWLLDDYIASHYHEVHRAGEYAVLRRASRLP